MLKKSTSFVLAALGGSTYRTEYAFASSLAAAALDGLFDHPAGCNDAVPDPLGCGVAPVPKGFFNNLLGVMSHPSSQIDQHPLSKPILAYQATIKA